MPSIRGESDRPLANGVSEVETSTEHKKVSIDYQCDGYVLLIIKVGAMFNLPKAESQRR